MKRILAFLLVPMLAMAQPTYDLTTDVNYPDRKLKPLTFLQGSTPRMRVFVQQNGATYTNIASDTMVMSYGTSGNADAFVFVTNSAVATATGAFTLDFTAANLNTNGSFWYTALLTGAGGGTYYSGDGSLEIKKTTVTGAAGSLDLSTPIDWSTFTYTSPGSAPMIVGTNLLASTNGSGQVTVSSAPSGSSTLSAVLTAGNDAENQTIQNVKSLNIVTTNASAPSYVQGAFVWDDDHNTVGLQVADGVTKSLDNELMKYIKNLEGAAITNGQAVYLSGTAGHNYEVKLADYDAEATARVYGFVTETTPLANNGFGWVSTVGTVHDLDTSGLTEGAGIWLAKLGDGINGYNWTTNKPDIASKEVVFLGYVGNAHGTQGAIEVNIDAPMDDAYIAADALKVSKSGDDMTGTLDMNTNVVDKVSSMNFVTNGVSMFTGTFLTTNAVIFTETTNTFYLLLTAN